MHGERERCRAAKHAEEHGEDAPRAPQFAESHAPQLLHRDGPRRGLRRGRGEVRGVRAPAAQRRVRQTPAPLKGLRLDAPVAPRRVFWVAQGTRRGGVVRGGRPRAQRLVRVARDGRLHAPLQKSGVRDAPGERRRVVPRDGAPRRPRVRQRRAPGVGEAPDRLVEKRAPQRFPRGARVSRERGAGGVSGERVARRVAR